MMSIKSKDFKEIRNKKFLINKKSQAAIEFLMTYGWAILVVLIAVGALAYFGVLNKEKILPSNFIENETIEAPINETLTLNPVFLTRNWTIINKTMLCAGNDTEFCLNPEWLFPLGNNIYAFKLYNRTVEIWR